MFQQYQVYLLCLVILVFQAILNDLATLEFLQLQELRLHQELLGCLLLLARLVYQYLANHYYQVCH